MMLRLSRKTLLALEAVIDSMRACARSASSSWGNWSAYRASAPAPRSILRSVLTMSPGTGSSVLGRWKLLIEHHKPIKIIDGCGV